MKSYDIRLTRLEKKSDMDTIDERAFMEFIFWMEDNYKEGDCFNSFCESVPPYLKRGFRSWLKLSIEACNGESAELVQQS